MAELVFEIWQHDADNSIECSPVSEQGDRLRNEISPDSRRIHIFTARSWNEAMTKHHDHLGWEPYQPFNGEADRHFSDAAAAEQMLYLAVRDVG